MDLETSMVKVEINHQAYLGSLSNILKKPHFNNHRRYSKALPRAGAKALPRAGIKAADHC